MVQEINITNAIRRDMNTVDELRYLAAHASNRNASRLGFLEHAYHHYKQENKLSFEDTLENSLHNNLKNRMGSL